MVELVQRNNVTRASERQHGVASGNDYMVLRLPKCKEYFLLVGIYTVRHFYCNVVVLVRNRTIRAYVVVVVILNLGYLASSVTVVTSVLVHSRLLCGEGLCFHSLIIVI